MIKRFSILLVLALIPFLGKPATVNVEATLMQLVGNWTGKVFFAGSKDVGRTDNLTCQAIIDNKFLYAELNSLPGSSRPLQGRGYFMYDPNINKYRFYWFDSDGFNGEYQGEKKDNTLVMYHDEPHRGKLKLTITFRSPQAFDVAFQQGNDLVETISYTKQ